jgi:predicted  nucleic acid-binding Zn-ribbon protein
VVDRLRAETVSALDDRRSLQGAIAEVEDRYHRLNGKLASQEAELRSVQAERGRAAELAHVLLARDAELNRLYEREREQEDQLKATYAEIERLGKLIENMQSTRAWRLHQSWQRLLKR